MECCDPDPIRIKEPTSRVVKTGYLTIYERGFFVNGWKDRYFKLYADSSLLWYHGNNDGHHKGGIRLKMVANFIAVGPMCLHTVGFPKLPKGRHVIHLMGVPDIFKKNTKRRNIKMNWILFPTDGDMQAWLQAIKPTLPSPPSRPEHLHHSINRHQVRPEHPHHSINGHQDRPEHHQHPRNGTQVTPEIAPESSNGDQVNLYPTVNVVRYQPECQHINTRDETTFSGIQRGVILGGPLGYGIDGYGPGIGWGWGWGWGPNPYGGFWESWNDVSGCGSVNIDRIVGDLCKKNNNYGYDINDVEDFERGNFSNNGGDGCGDDVDGNGFCDECCGDDCCWDHCCQDSCCKVGCCGEDCREHGCFGTGCCKIGDGDGRPGHCGAGCGGGGGCGGCGGCGG
ncbi:unnamed protein product [Mytilus edulis]|uniref:PH domain-containing protein n=1 Tax=Mytilus edulis TaxID=6550 RepID=A0A8S3V2B9_MYTED|nr:unnamed protein product [Mytilus edulis]